MKKKTLLPLERASWLKSLFLLVCLVLSGTTVFAQEKTVTGVVTDSFNEPLIGASIVVQGTTNGVITDLDGKYSIKVTPGAILQFSYVGMEKQSVKVGNQSVINVQLKDDSQMLAETVSRRIPRSRYQSWDPHIQLSVMWNTQIIQRSQLSDHSMRTQAKMYTSLPPYMVME